jgi:hypothetical protein
MAVLCHELLEGLRPPTGFAGRERVEPRLRHVEEGGLPALLEGLALAVVARQRVLAFPQIPDEAGRIHPGA